MSNIHGTLSRDRTCAYCDSSALPGGTMCSMHYKRAARGSCMNTPKREQLSPWGRVVEAALDEVCCVLRRPARRGELSIRAQSHADVRHRE